LPPPVIASNLIRNLGQDLFAPPNVKGWDGGTAWITTNTLLARYNETATLVQGSLGPVADMARGNDVMMAPAVERRLRRVRVGGVEVDRILAPEERADKEALLSALERRLLQAKLNGQQRQAVRDYLNAKGDLGAEDIRGAIRLLMCTPEYQLA
jgi:predicted nucleotidyltransferase